ncbi:MAG TPA: HAMP domain-containing sensor histidine kinase [Clostridia bacterium]
MTGIKKRLFFNYFATILFVLLSSEGIFIFSIHNYYYNSVEQTLKEKVESTTTLFNKYLNKNYADFNSSIGQILENNPQSVGFEIEVIDKNGRMLLCNSVVSDKLITSMECQTAFDGYVSIWKGKNTDTGEAIMYAAGPLKDFNANTRAVLRCGTSLEPADMIVFRYTLISGLVVLFILIFIWVSVAILGKTIIRPIDEINSIARKMAKGHFNERIKKHYNDEIGELADTLNYMASEILNAQELKNDFISSISHELRTPLTSIKGWSETILTGDFNPDETKKGLKVVLKETDRLKNMVDELLDFSKMEGGRLNLCFEDTDIVQEMEEVIKLAEKQVSKENVSIVLNLLGGVPKIRIDKNRMRQVLINLLDNAIKFSFQNTTITVNISNTANSLIIEIKDQGCGISREDLPKIKDMFYKGKSKKSGSGIGLAVCDEIIRLHGGALEISSEPNQGTSVKIMIPLSN